MQRRSICILWRISTPCFVDFLVCQIYQWTILTSTVALQYTLGKCSWMQVKFSHSIQENFNPTHSLKNTPKSSILLSTMCCHLQIIQLWFCKMIKNIQRFHWSTSYSHKSKNARKNVRHFFWLPLISYVFEEYYATNYAFYKIIKIKQVCKKLWTFVLFYLFFNSKWYSLFSISYDMMLN
jgi:hypothetical protein